jgi:para-nitrobenzyl esterase
MHSSELRFVFGYFPSHKETSMDDTVADILQTYWTSFARTGKPEASGLPPWHRFSAASGNYLHFASTTTSPTAAASLGGKSCTILTGNMLPASY